MSSAAPAPEETFVFSQASAPEESSMSINQQHADVIILDILWEDSTTSMLDMNGHL